MRFHLWHKAPTHDHLQIWAERSIFHQFITYCIGGASMTLAEFALFNVLLWIFAPTQPLAITVISAVSYFVSTANGYLFHRRWTFNSAAPYPSRYWRFVLLVGLTLTINSLLVFVFSSIFPFILPLSPLQNANLSKALALCGSGCVSFLGNKYWVFHRWPSVSPQAANGTALGGGRSCFK